MSSYVEVPKGWERLGTEGPGPFVTAELWRGLCFLVGALLLMPEAAAEAHTDDAAPVVGPGVSHVSP